MTSDRIRIRSLALPALFFLLMLATTFAGAQNFRGGINGTVTDQAGGVIAGADVQIRRGCNRRDSLVSFVERW